MQLDLNHFQAALIFALLSSIVLGIVTKNSTRDRVRYGARCFGWFIVALFGIGWFMHFLHG
ncbi:MAG: hypothetical protein JO061_17770 [Acidobacteriaceae bacterium]|nr:hypothetical protein [Acidobacteriaceae bacterium]